MSSSPWLHHPAERRVGRCSLVPPPGPAGSSSELLLPQQKKPRRARAGLPEDQADWSLGEGYMEHQPREHPCPCRGTHDMRARPMTWNVSGLCDTCERIQKWEHVDDLFDAIDAVMADHER